MKQAAWIFLVVATACAVPSAPRSDLAAPPSPAQASPAQSSPAQSTQMRIERGLRPRVQVEGEDVRFSIEERMRQHRIPAVSIAVFSDYELQWAQAYGTADVDVGDRANEETIFLAGSISKSVHALAVLLAATDGTLSLDQPVNELLESWKLPDNELTRASPVTLRGLLSHTAGTTVHGFPGYAAGEEIPTVLQILDGVEPANTPAIRVDLAPGTRYRYSGGGTTVTQLALTERSKRPYPEVLAARVLTPLGMVHSTFEQALPPDRLKHAAAGHGSDGSVIRGKRFVYPEMAAAGLWTTPSDLARCFIEIALARANRSARLPSAIATQMTTKVIDARGSEAVGLGVFLSERNGAQFFGHGGVDAGFHANVIVSLDGGYGLVVMANSDNGFEIFHEIERAVFAEYGWPGADPRIVRVALEPAQRARFVGQFLIGNFPIAIADSDGKLELRSPFGPAIELVPIATDCLVARHDGAELRLDATGSLEVKPVGQPVRKAVSLTGSARHHLFELEAGRFDDAVAAWRERARSDPRTVDEDENSANQLGYAMMGGDLQRAIEVFRLVATVFPESSNAHDSLGEAWMSAGDEPRAIAAYEASLSTLDADARIPTEMKAARRRHGEAQLERLRAQ